MGKNIVMRDNEQSNYWKIRSEKYNNLEWVSDNSYIDNLMNCSDLSKNHLVLDVGTGTGVVTINVKDKVSSVIALDMSNDMLSKGEWDGVSFINWDIKESLFDHNIFDRVIGRMVFHHITENIDHAFCNCYNYLKPGGKMIVAEAIPPSNSDLVVNWFTDMFSHKEDRVTFVSGQLEYHLNITGFSNVESYFFSMSNFSINNWIENSGLSQDKIDNIIKIHLGAPQEVKDAYNMKIDGRNILIDSKYTIVVGKK